MSGQKILIHIYLVTCRVRKWVIIFAVRHTPSELFIFKKMDTFFIKN